jgi:hypothetical protein
MTMTTPPSPTVVGQPPHSLPPLKRRERDAIIQSLGSGVVPRIGLQHIQVGRRQEVAAILKDVQAVQQGASSFRFVIGTFGSGKTFFLHLAKMVALEQRFVVVHADLAPERRLSGSSGVARSLYQELTRNCATKAKPEGGALASVIERWIADAGLSDTPSVEDVRAKLRPLEDLVAGHDFAAVIAHYIAGSTSGDEARKANAIRWLRGEYGTKTEARQDLGVRSIIEDATFYDHLKLLGAFVRLAGFAGLMVVFDEAINLYKLAQAESRSRNYETILRMFNDCLQGGSSGMFMLMGGTPEFLRDQRRGLYSYGALRSRLPDNAFATDGRRDLNGPIIELPNLSPEDLVVLLQNLRRIHAFDRPPTSVMPDEGIQSFMEHCGQRLGDAFYRTPRDSVVSFIQLLNLLEQNTGMDWREPLGKAVTAAAEATQASVSKEASAPDGGDDLVSFKL